MARGLPLGPAEILDPRVLLVKSHHPVGADGPAQERPAHLPVAHVGRHEDGPALEGFHDVEGRSSGGHSRGPPPVVEIVHHAAARSFGMVSPASPSTSARDLAGKALARLSATAAAVEGCVSLDPLHDAVRDRVEGALGQQAARPLGQAEDPPVVELAGFPGR